MNRFLIALVPGACFLLVSIVNASPLFSLNTQADWQNELNIGGKVSEVTTPYAALAHYGTAGIDYVQVTPTLSALTAAQSGLGDGLQMEWGDDTQDLPQVAAWEYVYDADPNLTGTVLRLTITPPAGIPPGAITEISLTLTDTAGDWMSWFWDVIPPGPGPTGVPVNVPTLITLDPTLHANQANSTSFTEAVGGFDHTIAISITADELIGPPGPGGINWTTFPPAPVSSGPPVWNYWSGLSVTNVPIPAAFWLFGSALGLLGWMRRKTA